MAIWVCRTGTYGQYEKTFMENSCICLTREGFDFNLSKCSKAEVVSRICEMNHGAARQTVSNTWSQIDIFSNRMAIGDIVLIPKKKSLRMSVGKVASNYVYDEGKTFPLNHSRRIKLLAKEIDTSSFPQDLRYSLGAFRTIFCVRQEERLISALKTAGVNFDEI